MFKLEGIAWVETLRQERFDVFENLKEGQDDWFMANEQEETEGPH